MIRSILVLPDGTRLSSGAPGAAILSTSLTRQVNPDTDLMPGGVCAAKLECRLTEASDVAILPGDRLQLYCQENEDAPVMQGVFIAQQPQRKGLGILELTAYDNLSLLDKDLTGWLMGLTGWPYSLQTFAGMVCKACGLELVPWTIPNGSCPVGQFSVRGVTGRELMQWVCQASGRFCRANAEGKVELFWYSSTAEVTLTAQDTALAASFYAGDQSLRLVALEQQEQEGDVTVTAPMISASHDGAGNVTWVLGGPRRNYPIFRDTLVRADYLVKSPDQVQLRKDSTDAGTLHPSGAAGDNLCVLTGNPLLTACTGQELQPVAEVLYELLHGVSYTPCSMEIPANTRVQPGQILKGMDLTGKTFTLYVMTTRLRDQRMYIECTGNLTRGNSSVSSSYQVLKGKILQLQADVDGLTVRNADSQGNAAAMELELGNIRTSVTQQTESAQDIYQQISLLQQRAAELQVKIATLEQDGVSCIRTETGYTFDDTGLRISKSGQQMDNLLDHTGMYVQRGSKMILRANDAGVGAVDVTVENYLTLGDHARFRDYSNGIDSRRTACFYTYT